MSRFASPCDAKVYLIGRIVAEAERRGVSLSDIERRMLYFTEVEEDPGVGDLIELNDEFERQYDTAQYESKIADLIRTGINHSKKENPDEAQAWRDAIYTLETGDHYILVMVDAAGASQHLLGPLAALNLRDVRSGLFEGPGWRSAI